MTEAFNWLNLPAASPSKDWRNSALAHQQTLTKPAGSLGTLESIAVQFSAFQKQLKPQLKNVNICVFTGDHGVCEQGVSAFPQAVTVQMIDNFVAGGAAISVLAKQLGANFKVINMGTAHPLLRENGVHQCVIERGTQDFSQQAAMTESQCAQALLAGREFAQPAELFIGGEMGIGNTTSASAIYCALLDMAPEEAVGPGTGVDQAGIQRKCAVIKKALALHALSPDQAIRILQCLGGFEIAALVGAYIGCAQKGIPILVDGFITTAAALLAVQINPSVKEWMLFSHQSAEPAHQIALAHLQVKPLLDLGMRLGEGSGAAVAVPIIQSAIALHNNMATFAQAGVSEA